jgi:uncharacterized membrane protein YfcA
VPDILGYLVLVVVGFLAGIINTIAGGGSFLTLPALMLFGLEPRIANATNRVAVLFSSGSAVMTFHRHGHFDKDLARRLTIPTMCGVPFGVLLAVYLPTNAFEPVFGLIFLVMAGLLVLKPKRINLTQAVENLEPISSSRSIVVAAVFFALGIYVGFIQAGMGILMLLAMSWLCRGDLVQANAVKNFVGFAVTLVAVAVFLFYGLIDWLPGLVMAIGNVVGGVVGAKLAIKKGNRLIFVFLVVVMVATGLKLIVSSLW